MKTFRKDRLLPVLLLGPAVALADIDTRPVDDQILRQFDTLRDERRATEQAQRLETLREDVAVEATPAPRKIQERDAECWTVSTVRVQDNLLLDTKTLQLAMQPWVSNCIGVDGINQMLLALTGAYVTAGYIAARPYVTRMPEAGGELVIAMLEGFIESIEMADGSTDLSLGSAFPGMVGRPLKLTDVESGLDQLNRLRSVDLTWRGARAVGPGNDRGRAAPTMDVRHGAVEHPPGQRTEGEKRRAGRWKNLGHRWLVDRGRGGCLSRG